jgi:phage shock protein C
MIFGVCGGIAEYLDLDPTLVRILFVLAAVLSGGIVLLAYVVLAIIMPRRARLGPISSEVVRENLEDLRDRVREMGDDLRGDFGQEGRKETGVADRPMVRRGNHLLIGLILVMVGVVFLLDNLRVFGWWQAGKLWPLILVGIGIVLILRRRR